MPAHIKRSSFSEVLPVWERYLWPDRKSEIRAQSSLTLKGGNDMSVYENDVHFYTAVVDDVVVGVNSVFKTGEGEFRSRGLFVFPEHRGKSVARLLLDEAVRYAKANGGTLLWSIPRVSAFPAYQKAGFEVSHSADESTMEFGPNIYAVKKI